MHLKTLLAAVAAVAILATAAPAFAFVGCVTIPTLDNAAVNHPQSSKKAGSNANLGGTAYTKAAFCPAGAAANNTCTGESLSEKVDSQIIPAFITLDGIVPDNHRKTLFGFPVGPVLPGPC